MKKIFLLLFVFLNIGLNAQQASLQVQTDAPVSMHGKSFWKDLYVSSADTNFVASAFDPNPDFLLKPGSYKITAVSWFNHQFSQTVQLKSGESKLFVLKGLKSFYKNDKSKKCITKSWKTGDSLFIVYNVAGWTKPGIDRFLFIKQDKGIRAQIFSQDNKVLHEALLTAEAEQEVYLLEKYIREIKGKNACSSIETYTINFKKKCFSVNDLSCSGGQLTRVYKLIAPSKD